MINLTVQEAVAECDKLVEENLKLLQAYRVALAKGASLDLDCHKVKLDLARERTNLLRNVFYYGVYLQGAKTMLLRLRDNQMTIEEHITGGNHKTKDKLRITSDMKVMNKAVFDLILKDKLNTQRFLEDGYTINFTDHERDKKGKLTKCRAYFARKVVKYEEI